MDNEILTQPVDLPEGEGFNTIHKSVVGAVNELNAQLSAAKQSASEADLKAQKVKARVADLETKMGDLQLQTGATGPAGPQGERGEQGLPGEAGAAGKSAFEIANEVRAKKGEQPFATEEEFITSLRGADGEAGKDGKDGQGADISVAEIAESETMVQKFVTKAELRDEEGYEIYARAAELKKKADKSYVDEHVGSKAEAVAVEALMRALEGKQDKIDDGVYAPAGNYTTMDEVAVALKDYVKIADVPDTSNLVSRDDLAEGLANVSTIKGDKGDTGLSAYELAIANGFEGSQEDWLKSLRGNDGSQGVVGPQGETGKDGKSAYEVAVANGFTGNEAEWLASLKGEGFDASGFYSKEEVDKKMAEAAAGEAVNLEAYAKIEALNDKADKADVYSISAADAKFATAEALEQGLANVSTIKGDKGDAGVSGKSAYEIAVANGFEGSESAWLESLRGLDGKDGLPGINGVNGKSAYEVAVANGFEGTEAEFIASLKGEAGSAGEAGAAGKDGKSAFEIAKELNPELADEAAFIASLKGEKGDPGEIPDVENFVQKEDLNGYVKTEDIPAQKTLAELGGVTADTVTEIIKGYNFLSSEAIKTMIDEAIAKALNPNNGEETPKSDEPAPSDEPTPKEDPAPTDEPATPSSAN